MKLNINDEQEIREFNEDEIDILHFIFERELKPPLSRGDKDEHGLYPYYNQDDDYIGWLDSDKHFAIRGPIWPNIKYKVCSAFGFHYDTWDWWVAIKPHLTSWLEDRLNVKLKFIGY